jgi:GT2 family glycosyltransferase
MLREGERHPKAAAIAPRLERPDGTLEHSTFPFPSARVAAITALGAYDRLWPKTSRRLCLVGSWDHNEARDVDWAVGAALLMRKTALDEIGGFDERFFMYAEDLEWCWRAHKHGWTIRFEPGAIVRHIGNASGRKNYGNRRTRAHLHNSYRFYRREHGAAATALYRAINIGGCSRLDAIARLRGDKGARAEWASHLRALLERIPAQDSAPAQ